MPKQARALLFNNLTIWHQVITLIGVPAGLALMGWIGVSFIQMGKDITALTVSMGFVQQDVGRHTTELQQIQDQLNRR